jgi:tetratricopeptide (TPR) repeat protein
MEIATRLDDLYLVANAAGTMGIIYWSRGDFEQARRFCQQSIDTARQIDHWWAVGRALITLGNVNDAQGQMEPAFACYEQALEIGGEIGDRQCCAWAVINMGNLYKDAGDVASALACYHFGLETALEIGDRWSVSISLIDMAEMYALQGQEEEAERFYHSGTALAHALNVNYLCEYLLSLARFYARQERFAEARQINDEARRLARESGRRRTGGEDTVYRSHLLDVRLRQALGQVDTPAALAELEEMLNGVDDGANRAQAWYEIWRLAPDHHLDGQQAADVYRGLSPAEVRGIIRRHYRAVTGEEPPPPPDLPSLPQLVPPDPAGTGELLARADAIRSDL